jgi:nucleotide-binding universal stress UspA family protein
VALRPQIITGIPYREIISQSSAYDLLVIGGWNASSSYPGPFLAGSTLREVVTHTQLPALCVTGPLQKLEAILVAYDDSRAAQDALQLATTWTQAWGLTLNVLVVQSDGEQAQQLLRQARRRVEPVTPRLIAREGDPAKVIKEIAAQNHCDLISLGVPSQHLWFKHSLGRTIDTLLQTGNLPLLLSH